jgi:uncharacterized protein (TIGR02646 family)
VRYIIKGSADANLTARFNLSKPKSPGEAKLEWRRFKFKNKTSAKCNNEQFGLCCYAEVCLNNLNPIIDNTGSPISKDLGCHIEHVEPKSKIPPKTFDHANLTLSAIHSGELANINKKDVFGGHAKGNKYDAKWFISPLNSKCNDYFYYETSGKVVPKASLPNRKEKAKARLTIYLLNLNAPILIHWRRTYLNILLDEIDTHDDDSIIKLANAELGLIKNNLRPFHSARRQIFGRLGDEICKKLGI